MKKAISLLICTILFVCCFACTTPQGDTKPSNNTPVQPSNPSTDNGLPADTFVNPIATINIEGGAVITLELLPQYAPYSVAQFIRVAQSGFYEGVIFHRIISGVIQAGGFYVNGAQLDYKPYSGQPIIGEFADNGIANGLSHTAGVISMARSSDPNSATTQFFICTGDCSYYDGSYAAFGRTITTSGLETCIAISQIPTYTAGNMQNFPEQIITISSVTIELNDYVLED